MALRRLAPISVEKHLYSIVLNGSSWPTRYVFAAVSPPHPRVRVNPVLNAGHAPLWGRTLYSLGRKAAVIRIMLPSIVHPDGRSQTPGMAER